MSNEGFLSRWSRRKVEVKDKPAVDADRRDPVPLPVEKPIVTTPPPAARTSDSARPSSADPNQPAPGGSANADEASPPKPTLADVDLLTRDDSFARFVARDVDPDVRNAAMKKLFTDPHYNVMDGLDTYIDDYGKPDPIPIAMLRLMVQSKSLGLFDHEEEDQAKDGTPPDSPPQQIAATAQPVPDPDAAALPPEPETPEDEDPDLQLQPDDGDRCAGAGPGTDDDPKS